VSEDGNPIAQNTAPQALGRTAAAGFLWLVSASALAKVAGFAAYIVLGWLLLPVDWGLYALVLGVAALVQFLREAGLGPVLVQKGQEAFDTFAGPAFWLALAFNGTVAFGLAAAAPLIAGYLNQPDVAPLLWVFAAVVIAGTPGTIYRAKLQVDLRFREFSILGLATSLVRALVLVVLAYSGAGAMALVVGQLALALTAVAVGYRMTRIVPWTAPPRTDLWPGLLGGSAWVMLGNLASGLGQRADYIVFGLLVAIAVLGQYTFANEFVALTAALLEGSAGGVLLPALARVAGQARRYGAALARSMRVLMLAAAGTGLFLAVIVPAFESLLWQGKWARAVPAMQAFAVAMPFQLLFVIVLAALRAEGAFARQTGVIALRAALVFAAAGWAVLMFRDSPGGLAAFIAAASAAFGFLAAGVVLHNRGCGWAQILRTLLEGWGPALAAAACAIVLDGALMAEGQPAAIRLIAVIAAFSLSFAVAARLLLRATLNEAMDLLPAKIGALGRRLLFLS
jgi:O-antigen/teichoic acid export membrane protein